MIGDTTLQVLFLERGNIAHLSLGWQFLITGHRDKILGHILHPHLYF